MSTRRVDLSADLGESFGIYTLGDDEALMPFLTSASVAAGFHAGDPSTIRRTIRLAKAHGVAVGAHPAFPDLIGFGRREVKMSHQDVEDAVLYQIASVAGIARAEGVDLRHVKPHGALYNSATVDEPLAEAIVSAVSAYSIHLQLFAPPGSVLARAARARGLGVVYEGFADRAYTADGRLVPREHPGAIVVDHARAASQAVSLVLERSVTSIDGARVSIHIDTLCLHGDTPDAAARAAFVRHALEQAGVEVRAPRYL